jgi:carbon storage regulator
MLVLSRRVGESVFVGKDIEVIVLGTRGSTVRIGFVAPPEVSIQRKEVRLRLLDLNDVPRQEPAEKRYQEFAQAKLDRQLASTTH